MTIKHWLLPVAVAALLVGCGGAATTPTTSTTTTTSSSSSTTTAAATITIKDFKYAPATVTVKKGQSIKVINEDLVGHSVTADDKSFDSGVLSQGKSAILTMDKVGTFKIHCLPHPNITGTITVTE